MTQHIPSHKPIGILGGTFNPIHHGHLRLALELYERLDLAEVRLIPSARPPHREPPSISAELRLQMAKIAVAEVSGLRVDDRELQRVGLSYMVDTLGSLRLEYPHTPIFLILGMDAFMTLPHWHQWEKFITLAHLLVVRRPGKILPMVHLMRDFLNTYQVRSVTELLQQPAGHILVQEIPALTISATQIRGLIANGKNPHYLLPESVLNFIHTHHLYL
jgi:nicotinate-nucleotide adenylyltransferase